MNNTDTDRMEAAVHEAGHMVVAWHLVQPRWMWARIWPSAAGQTVEGEVVWDTHKGTVVKPTRTMRAAIAAAGHAAVAEALGMYYIVSLPDLSRIAAQGLTDLGEERAYRLAERTVIAHLDQIRAVAAVLLAEGQVTIEDEAFLNASSSN